MPGISGLREMNSTPPAELSHALAALSDHLGLQGRHLLGSVLGDLLRPQNTKTLRQAKEQRELGEYLPYTLEFSHASGTLTPITAIPRPVYLEGQLLGCTAVLVRHDTLVHSIEQRLNDASGPRCTPIAESEAHKKATPL